MKTVIIERERWRSGGSKSDPGINSHISGEDDTKLLNPSGYMCCLGFVCEQLGGFALDDLYGREYPRELTETKELEGLLVEDKDGRYVHTHLTNEAIEINDDNSLSLQEREKQLAELFEPYGVELVFTGDHEVPDA